MTIKTITLWGINCSAATFLQKNTDVNVTAGGSAYERLTLVDTWYRFTVCTTSYKRHIDVETTSYVYWDGPPNLLEIFFSGNKGYFIFSLNLWKHLFQTNNTKLVKWFRADWFVSCKIEVLYVSNKFLMCKLLAKN